MSKITCEIIKVNKKKDLRLYKTFFSKMPQKLLSNPKLYLFNEFKAKGKPAKAAKIRTKKNFTKVLLL